MITVHSVSDLRLHVRAAKQAGKTVGLVPTMGNLHDGHISLIEQAKADSGFVVASIFVNPLQFDDKQDLARYPRTLPADQAKLEAVGCDLLFAPDVNEMYPNGQEQHCLVHVPGVSEGLCGGKRPGHFDGVATVVSKLFNMAQPDFAFFGQKDFQQVAVIRKFVADLNFPIDIISVPIKRAASGLALSSRNGYLTDSDREQAAGLYRCLQQVASTLQQGQSITAAVSQGEAYLREQGFTPDYLEVRRQDLQLATDKDYNLVILVAAFIGGARLIDNLEVSLQPINE